MELLLRRYWPNSVATIGALYVDSANSGFTLELPLMFQGQANVPDLTCIPAGRYRILLQPSPHFEASTDPWIKQFAAAMPHLQAVAGRTLIMVHFGNVPGDSEGCIIVGNIRMSLTEIGDSRAAFQSLYGKITLALRAGQEVWITIEDDSEPADVWP